ncbi:leucyl aminopeptidase family protein [Thioalkalivibrio sp.]|uniref:leucyl aminopeptidase family protein n=1 Tax=Thioalkalivibrio sp. TaxID=2093813 RepID=UPI003561E35A
MESHFVASTDAAISLVPVTTESLPDILSARPERWRNWAEHRDFEGRPGTLLRVPSVEGRTEGVLVGYDAAQPVWMLAHAAQRLEAGVYRLDEERLGAEARLSAAVGWGLGCYRFQRYRNTERALPRLAWPDGVDARRVEAMVAAHALVRDLINTPARDLMPEDLAGAATEIAAEFGAEIEALDGPGAIADAYPCIHAVGSASAHPPRVIEVNWGEAGQPRVVLVGKGVCFDSGGLNLKPGNGMRLMKKDMGGAAIALGLGRLIMELGLPLRLTLLLGAAENAVGSRSFRPGDVLTARNGKTVEIDNTDAEGRLLLADLLVRAGEFDPDLVIDFATLTGAARVAVGTEISAFFSTDPDLARGLIGPAEAWDDPVWELPLHEGYRHMLKSDIADTVNSSSGGFAGAITAALFLKDFAPQDVPWLHFDVMAWNNRNRPGRPKGGEAMGLRAVLGLLESRFASG